jgi:succinate dehydrogenase / fumarate reductase cytochrome b subunit
MPATTRSRPYYLNLFRIRLPLPGFVSILHRVSGFFLFAGTPLVLWALQKSLSSATAYADLAALLSFTWIGIPIVKLMLLGLGWALFHHLFAGIRYLIIDVNHNAADLPWARKSSMAVLIVSLALTAVLGVRLW